MITTHTEMMDPRAIEPLHEIRDAATLAALTADMQAHGWMGRPLLVLRDGVDMALTGTHRLGAAIAAGLDAVPCVVIETDDYEADLARWEAIRDAHGDDERAVAIDGITDLMELERQD
jgi:ParB-like chromosome segregation protein Spo0J